MDAPPPKFSIISSEASSVFQCLVIREIISKFISSQDQMSRLFTSDIFRYSPLVPGGGRASRNATFKSFSMCSVLAVAVALLSVAIAGFFVGRLSLTEHDRSLIRRELDLIPKCPQKCP